MRRVLGQRAAPAIELLGLRPPRGKRRALLVLRIGKTNVHHDVGPASRSWPAKHTAFQTRERREAGRQRMPFSEVQTRTG